MVTDPMLQLSVGYAVHALRQHSTSAKQVVIVDLNRQLTVKQALGSSVYAIHATTA
jgi:hypothetical protein